MTNLIELNDVSIEFPVFDAKSRSFKSQVANLTRGVISSRKNNSTVMVKSLDGLSFSLSEGDKLGLIGNNGAGKSTLLKLLAGIYEPTKGTIDRKGKIVPLLDIALGMDDDSTGYQNIKLRGLLLGMSNSEIDSKIEEIASFTELGDYLDLPIRVYSTGMRVRLAFAVSTSVDPDVLLLDEIIGTGDASFLNKAKKRFEELKERAKVVVLSSHDNNVILNTCNKVLWLEGGKPKMLGEPEQVLNMYMNSVR
ncbi:ABC transporter ATP-binding protein [Plesiomonas shigelloides]|uniref:O-antigen ABC transporter ATP-binding protein Wzt n=2 Tax=Bacteria TaxID=2 RepID=A0A4D6U7I0_PLESH|nr:ABC transporter ATP-binding protein [Plesiomonas shigelloides]KAB7690408.1 ATP-binding cassette domain-containing protein [Plesiomonas shigelloides]QCH03182.1 O-antigen ABC transporter ATP-binding protein Wzt [Plesiomonas shigelloides]